MPHPSPARSKPKNEDRQGVDADVVRIGKDVIELLTSGMYVSPMTIFREYVQNAADGIDAVASRSGKATSLVSLTIDHSQRTVTIRDNGAALPARDAVVTLLSIGGSAKRGTTARGFRGVGRLSGLAYCRELEFRSKAAGEDVVTHVSWDCRELRRRLADGASRDDLRSIVTSSVSVWTNKAEDVSEHFFEVVMQDVARHRHDLLLNEQMIAHYLGQVAPVAFAPAFSFGPMIEARLSEAGVARHPIALSVNGEPVYRPFRDEMPLPGSPHTIHIENIEFLEFADVDGGVAAVAWLAHHAYVRGLPASLGIRGLRARVGDVQVGESNLFEGLYKEPRFNGWTIGEVHVADRRIVPNGRRDDFEVNHHAYNLTAQLASVASSIASRCRTASIGRNAEQTILRVLEEAQAVIDGPGNADVALHRAALHRVQGKLRVIPDEEVRDRHEAELRRVEKKLSKPRPRPAVLPFTETKALITRLVKNKAQARALLTALEKISVST